MEPTLPGPRVELRCPICGRTTCLTAEIQTLSHLEDFRYCGCRACGYTLVPVQPNTVPGSSLKITSKWRHFPKRWEVVLVTPPTEDDTPPAIKRVIGLPGERVEIVRGEILIDGQPVHDAPWDQKLTAVDSMTPRREGRALLFTHTAAVPFGPDQAGSPRPDPIPTPLTNEIPRLETAQPIALEYLHDFALDVTLSSTGGEEPIRIVVDQGDLRWLVTFDRTKGVLSVAQAPGKSEKAIGQWQTEDFSRTTAVSVSLGDVSAGSAAGCLQMRFLRRNAEFLLDGQSWLIVPANISLDDWKKGKNIPISTPAAVLLPGNLSAETEDPQTLLAACGIEELTLLRGVCFSEPNPTRVYEVPRGCYFLLGDNSAASIDSRLWPAFVPRRAIRGTVTSCL
ncbi:MAG: hypothetical protein IIZ25_00075 [Thermoguttaceae bacterium]|nr:hypothetical protein [Thermoguttaceae bacterium]